MGTGDTTRRRAEYCPPMVRSVYTLIGTLSWPVVYCLYRLDARGLENLPTSGGFVLAANHWSMFDPWPLAMPLWPRRPVRYMTKSELYNPIFTPILNAAGGFPVERGTGDVSAIERGTELARDGEIVVMFPEGTRRTKGRRKKFTAKPQTGAARIALSARVPLVPAAIVGTDSLSRLTRIRVRYGPPVQLDDLAGSGGRSAAQATERLMSAIYRLEADL